MSFRDNTAPKDSLGRYSVYCRMCGYVTKDKSLPDFCVNCGNIEVGEGAHFSGDNSFNEVSTVVAGKLTITNVQKRRR